MEEKNLKCEKTLVPTNLRNLNNQREKKWNLEISLFSVNLRSLIPHWRNNPFERQSDMYKVDLFRDKQTPQSLGHLRRGESLETQIG